MKKGIQKMIAGTLVLLMILAMVPTFAFAEGEETAAASDENGISADLSTDNGDNTVNTETETKPEADAGEAKPETEREPGISAVDENGVPTPGITPETSAFGLGDLIPDLGGEGSDVPLIGYSKFVYIVPADIGEGAESWARINVVKEVNGEHVQLAHGAIPVGYGLINTVGISLTPYAREHYTITDVLADGASIGAKDIHPNYANFTYYTLMPSFNNTLTIVLDGNGGDTPETPDEDIWLYYLSEGKVVDSESKTSAEGKADFVLKEAPAREGFEFKGWQYGEKNLQPGETLTLAASDSVTAVWTEKGGETDPGAEKVTLSFDSNGGEGGPANKQYDKDVRISLDLEGQPQPSHAQTGSEESGMHNVLFMGWTMEQYPVLKSGDEIVMADHVVKMDSSKTAYALWGVDMNDNNIPDVIEKLNYTLSYNETLGIDGTGPADKTDCTFNQQVNLDYSVTPVAEDRDGCKVIFMYWTDRVNAYKHNASEHIFGKDYVPEELPDKLTGVQMISDVEVYAVWSYDKNDDGIPDAFQREVELNYNPNTGAGGPGTEKVITKTTVTLKNEPAPTHESEGEVPVLFAGWTTEADTKIYEQGDTLPVNMVTELAVPENSQGEEVFAFYGYDRNGNNVPDVTEHKLSYDANGGEGGPGVVTVSVMNGYVLETENLPTHKPIETYDVLFYGWSLSKHALPLTAHDHDKHPEDIVKTIDIDGDEIVYAVWALDKNSNNVPDVDEDFLTLTFDINGGVEKSCPKPEKHIADEQVGLKHTFIAMHDDVMEGENAVPVALVGWTRVAYPDILEKDSNLAAVEYYRDSMKMPAEDTTVYALWGYDRNDDGIPDVVQTLVNLTYDPNGGEGGPGVVEVENESLQILERRNVPTHADVNNIKVAFLGWTMTPDEHIYEVGDEKPAAEKIVKINGDTTVYAVYGYDEDGNGKPDIDEYEKVFVLSFDPNGGLTAPEAQKALSKNGKDAYINITTELPSHETMEFKGWATTPGGRAEFRPSQRVKLESDVTLYAVWGEKGSGNVPGGIPGFDGGTGGKGIPKTGDESNLALWSVLASLSIMGMGATVVISRKHRKDN